MPSVANAIMDHSTLSENGLYIKLIQCFRICQLTKPLSSFRKIDASKCFSFQWKVLVEELSLKAPTLLKIFSSIVTANGKRKQAPDTGSHNPGLCMAVAILLKERNREMYGLQLIIYELHGHSEPS